MQQQGSQPEEQRGELREQNMKLKSLGVKRSEQTGEFPEQCGRLIQGIKEYAPTCEQEHADQRLMLGILGSDPACFIRDSLAHFTVSAWAVDEDFQKTLMVWHNIYRSWSWVGGHADGEADLQKVALKELAQETGARGSVIPLENPANIFSLEVLPVAGHVRKGVYVSSHVHLNVTYLCVVQHDAVLVRNPQENSGVAWVPLEGVEQYSTEPWMCENVYRKLISKTKLFCDG